MSRIALPSWWQTIGFALFVFGGVFVCGFAAGRLTAPPTVSTMEAVIDRTGMRWNDADTRRYCSESGYMHPAWDAYLTSAEVLPARDGADVGTLVCYWRIK